MTSDVRSALRSYFGFQQFRPGQEAVIGHLVAGRSAAAVFPTGGGKSICYQLPALLLDGVTLVVSPLIALMKDQIDALVARGIAAQRLDSTLSADRYRDVMQQVHSQSLKLLYVAPERFQNERQLAQATSRLPDRIGSQNRSLPSAILSAVSELSAGAFTVNGSAEI